MARKGTARFATIAIVTTGLLGLVGIGAAGATPLLSVSPSTALSDGQLVTITLSGVTTGALSTLQVAECGNAYGDGAPLPAITENSANCSVLTFANNLQTDPLVLTGVAIRQTGIGTSNRSCVDSPPAIRPCFVYVSSSVNQPTFPTADVLFTPTGTTAEPAPTATTLTPIGSPIGSDKVAHAYVHVVATGDPTMRPDEGMIDVLEGSNVVGSAPLVGGSANVTLATLGVGDHNLVAHYTGSGSFAVSDSPPATMSVIGPFNISIGDGSVVEGNSGVRTIAFPVVLSQPAPAGPVVTVSYSIAGSGANPATVGTATSGADIVSAAGVLKFKAVKQSVVYIHVKVNSNVTPASDKTFTVTLANPSAPYVLRRSQGVGTIFDDDTHPAGSLTADVGDATVPEGDAGGARNLAFGVTLSSPITTGTVTVTVQITSMTATHGTKKSGGDWGGKIIRSVVFKPNQVIKALNVPVYPDANDELDEYVSVSIIGVTSTSTPVVNGPHPNALGTILSDE